MSAITRFLPKNHLSYFVGVLTHLPLPKMIWTPIIKWFAATYKINLAEAEFDISNYKSLGEFFVRKLKLGIRPVGSTWNVHPADSVVTQAAKITDGKLIQAKNKFYNVIDLTNDSKALEKYDEGCFLTYYLCPTDYHRVHSPVNGVIQKITHIPGNLWPVNNWSTENIPELFSVNERVCVEIKTDRGLVNVIFVGATNVGQIILTVDSEIHGNQLVLSKTLFKENLNIQIAKGQELGMFRMGSTIVMLYQKNTLDFTEVSKFHCEAVKVNAGFQ